MTIEDIALTMTTGIGVKGAIHLMEQFQTAENVFSASLSDLIHEAGLAEVLARRIVDKEGFGMAEREIKHCQKYDIKAVASTDRDFPRLLKETNDFPHVLYIKGNVEALNGKLLSMVGTRKITQYGLRVCDELVCSVGEKIPSLSVVSGLAFGVDIACHRAALSTGVRTVAVLPNPLPGVTPVQHGSVAKDIVESGGALVTELHSQVKQNGNFYLARNRIIAGLSGGTVIVESPYSGGSLMTAHCADGYNRVVMAVPGRITDKMSAGANMLIRNKKAQAILSGDDIIRELMWDLDVADYVAPQKSLPTQLTSSEEQLLALFKGRDSVSIDEFAVESNLNISELSVILLGLEMSGVVRHLPGHRYERLT